MCVCVATGWQRQIIARQEIDNESRKSTNERASVVRESVCWDYEKSREGKLSKRNEIIIKSQLVASRFTKES